MSVFPQNNRFFIRGAEWLKLFLEDCWNLRTKTLSSCIAKLKKRGLESEKKMDLDGCDGHGLRSRSCADEGCR